MGSDATGAAPAPADPATLSCEGVTLAQYATVTAGLGDGIPLEAMLEHAAVEPAGWDAAHLSWSERLVDDLLEGASLTFALDTLQRRAREAWSRPLPPLDTDLQAWVDFQRAFPRQEDAIAWLDGMGLGPADLGALQRTWSARLAREPELAEELARIAAAEPKPLVVPRIAPARLPRRARDDVGGTQLANAVGDGPVSIPFAGRKGGIRLPPPLRAPLPEPPGGPPAARAHATGAMLVMDGITLPFVSAIDDDDAPPSQGLPRALPFRPGDPTTIVPTSGPSAQSGMTLDAMPAVEDPLPFSDDPTVVIGDEDDPA